MEDEELDYNNVSDLEDELRRLIRWSNQYGKGVDYKIEQLKKRIQQLKETNNIMNIVKEYRTAEQFESIADNCLNGNWTDSANECVKYGFFANDLRKHNEENELFTDLYDIAELAELAERLRNNL